MYYLLLTTACRAYEDGDEEDGVAAEFVRPAGAAASRSIQHQTTPLSPTHQIGMAQRVQNVQSGLRTLCFFLPERKPLSPKESYFLPDCAHPTFEGWPSPSHPIQAS